MRRVDAIAVVAVIGLAAAVTGCDHGTKPIVPATYRPLTTPYAPLFNLASAYAHRGVEGVNEYAAIFDSTTYQFVWDDPNVPGTANTWDYDGEMLAASGMLTDPAVDSIGLTFLATPSDSVGTPSTNVADPDGTLRFLINGVHLVLERPPTQYITSGSAEFYVARTDTVAGVPQWRIIRWVDRTGPPTAASGIAASNAVLAATWGNIKSLYRY